MVMFSCIEGNRKRRRSVSSDSSAYSSSSDEDDRRRRHKKSKKSKKSKVRGSLGDDASVESVCVRERRSLFDSFRKSPKRKRKASILWVINGASMVSFMNQSKSMCSHSKVHYAHRVSFHSIFTKEAVSKDNRQIHLNLS